jgi:hypothetical protein
MYGFKRPEKGRKKVGQPKGEPLKKEKSPKI